MTAIRPMTGDDLPALFEMHLDPVANRMAAFTPQDPSDRDAFMEKWRGILANEAILKRTVLLDDAIAGSIASFDRDGMREVTYWIAREHWGKGVATRALTAFLRVETARPLHARAAADNIASLRVLAKCGFEVCATEIGFANARGEQIEELILELTERSHNAHPAPSRATAPRSGA